MHAMGVAAKPEEESESEMDQLQLLGASLSRLAQEQVGIRQVVEDRWLEDLERYMGKYDSATASRLAATGGSKAFVNLTRAKTSVAEARLSDMLFPSDDKNWGIQPTPVPEMQKMTQSDAPAVNEMGQQMQAQDGTPILEMDVANAQLQEARDAARAMEKEINDQLTEARYHALMRDVIHDACVFGTGIAKAPVILNRRRKSWQNLGEGVHSMSMVQEFRPGVERVNVWDFFPDMAATHISECNFIFERRYVSKRQLFDLAGTPGYFPEEIRKVITSSPKNIAGGGETHVARLRELSGLATDLTQGRYEMWEYHGPLDKDDLACCGYEVGEDDEDDSLSVNEAVVTFVNGHVIKADINPMETQERPYSVFSYEQDDTSVFGFGLPYLVRHEQRIANASWRMALDNAALTTGGQVVINREVLIPDDGQWNLRPRKTWHVTDPTVDVRSAFATHETSSHLDELLAIYNLARNMADDVTALPMLAQGEMGGAPDTASGMSMLLNSSNVVLRRVVKSFDDDMTRPLITRFYDWNMQFNPKPEIKGDFEVDARGSSTLLVKETQTQALITMMQLAESPVFGPLVKSAALFRKVAQAQHITPDDVIASDEEIQAQEAAAQQAAQEPDPEMVLKEKELEVKLQIAQMNAEVQMVRISEQNDMSLEQVKAAMAKTQLVEDNKANIHMSELDYAEKEGKGI
jgi:hypothetical protein